MPTQETQPADRAGRSAVRPVAEVIALVREWVDRHTRSQPDFAGAYLWGGITAGHHSYPRASRRVRGRTVLHRTNSYLNNDMEQDQRGVQQRTYPRRRFGTFAAAARFCRADEEQRNSFRIRSTPHEKVSLGEQRRLVGQRFAALPEALVAASSAVMTAPAVASLIGGFRISIPCATI